MLQRNDSDRVMWVADIGQLVGPGDIVECDLLIPGCVPAEEAPESDSPAPKRQARPAPAPAAPSEPPASPAPSAAAETPPASEPESVQPDEAGQPAKETAP